MSQAILLHINSTTTICSVALSRGAELWDIQETTEANSHTEVITLFIEDLLQRNNITAKDLSAVALASGPGSYTSLRVGCSTAKGICFGLDIPLVAINSLEILANSVKKEVQVGDIIIPMIDARRMEVYAAVYDHEMKALQETHAHILTEESFEAYRNPEATHYYVGNGAAKALEVLGQKPYQYHEHFSSARYMIDIAFDKYSQGQYEDLAYYEPFYLKGANVTKSKKKWFGK